MRSHHARPQVNDSDRPHYVRWENDFLRAGRFLCMLPNNISLLVVTKLRGTRTNWCTVLKYLPMHDQTSLADRWLVSCTRIYPNVTHQDPASKWSFNLQLPRFCGRYETQHLHRQSRPFSSYEHYDEAGLESDKLLSEVLTSRADDLLLPRCPPHRRPLVHANDPLPINKHW